VHGRQVVVVTGASAGIGRATARAFGARGARVVLVARGQAGLEAAADEVRRAGGEALVVVADVADARQVEDAATRAEHEYGPVDIWVNAAFSSVFAPFWDVTAEEYERATQVTYLGFVNGTRSALARMRPRDRGCVVQVGSALGERSIPLQSVYCGAKHAINGFTSSVRTELMHEKSNVHITVAQMPGVDTPQFSWVLAKLDRHPRPVAPVYHPDVAARGVLYAADHPRRAQYWVGGSTVATVAANRVAGPLLDRYLARTGFASQQTDERIAGPDRPHNLWEPLDGKDGHDYGAEGVFRGEAHDRSLQLTLRRHVPAALAATGLVTAAAAGLWRRARH
jgi:NADP-dependent 3-hydroxy acid dehydrogenase YdfG